MRLRRFLASVLLIAGLHAVPHAARATQGYANCTKFIDTVPATISSQGVYCLRHDLSTSNTVGPAIAIAGNNITIDCNDFKLGGLAAGAATQATGISASGRQNATIRNCNIRGYQTGIALDGSGHLVEDNRLDNNLLAGIWVDGEHNLVRRNRVYATGGDGAVNAWGIRAYADIVDNIIDGVLATKDTVATHTVVGIDALGTGALVERNRIGGLQLGGTGIIYGIDVGNRYMTVAENNVTAASLAAGSVGIRGLHVEDGGGQVTTVTFCPGNSVGNFSSATSDCSSNGGANHAL